MQYKINKKSKHITDSFKFEKEDPINELDFSDSDYESKETSKNNIKIMSR